MSSDEPPAPVGAEELDSWEAVAIAATQGEWRAHGFDVAMFNERGPSVRIAEPCGRADRDHIATFDPPTARRLIAAARATAAMASGVEVRTFTRDYGMAALAASPKAQGSDVGLREALEEISDMLMSRPDIMAKLTPLIGPAEHAVFKRALAALAASHPDRKGAGE